eukprot:scaffold18906_cov122-Isochrysis_galbana.AAC.10
MSNSRADSPRRFRPRSGSIALQANSTGNAEAGAASDTAGGGAPAGVEFLLASIWSAEHTRSIRSSRDSAFNCSREAPRRPRPSIPRSLWGAGLGLVGQGCDRNSWRCGLPGSHWARVRRSPKIVTVLHMNDVEGAKGPAASSEQARRAPRCIILLYKLHK